MGATATVDIFDDLIILDFLAEFCAAIAGAHLDDDWVSFSVFSCQPAPVLLTFICLGAYEFFIKTVRHLKVAALLHAKQIYTFAALQDSLTQIVAPTCLTESVSALKAKLGLFS